MLISTSFKFQTFGSLYELGGRLRVCIAAVRLMTCRLIFGACNFKLSLVFHVHYIAKSR
ncbi:hypothetical protein WG66_010973, partial [Moniliophthora roreri]